MASKGGEEVIEMIPREWKKAFMRMKDMVEALYQKNQLNEEEEKEEEKDANLLSRLHHHLVMVLMDFFPKKSSHTHNVLTSHKPLLKVDVKFNLPIYDGELNEENLDNWVKKI